MALDRDGLSLLWDRIRMYVTACVIAIGIPDIATSNDVGLVKPDGDTITVDSDGTLHGADQAPLATTEVAGKVKPDGTTITVDENGTISGMTATSTTKGMLSVPSGNGLYVSNGALYANTASTIQYGMVRLADDGGLANASSRLRVRDATNVVSGKVLPDAETIGVVDGRLSVLSGSTEVRRVTPFSFEGMDYAVIRLAEDGIACFTGGTILFTYDYDYGSSGSGTLSSGFGISPMLARNGDLADEARINQDSSVTVVRNTAAIWLRGVAPYDSGTSYNLSEYQRYWSQHGIEKTQGDFDEFVIAKAAELSGDPSISDMSMANAYFQEHPYMEVRPLRQQVTYQSGGTFGGPPNSTFLFTEFHEAGYSAGLWDATFEWWWSKVECVPGFPEATDSSKGVVMPDNETITVRDGVLTAVGTHRGPYLDVREDTDGNRRIAIVIPEEE